MIVLLLNAMWRHFKMLFFCVFSRYCEVLFSHLLLNQAQVYTSFRFILESKVGGRYRPFILVSKNKQFPALSTKLIDTDKLGRKDLRSVIPWMCSGLFDYISATAL
jgi:hypothetical protein